MKNYYRALSTVLVACLAAETCRAGTAVELRPAVLSAQEIQHRLLRLNESIHAFRIIEESAPYSVGRQTLLVTVRVEIAARYPDCLSLIADKGSNWLEPSQDPFEQRLIISGDTTISGFPRDRVFMREHRRAGDPLVESAQGELLFVVLGWWPLETVAPPDPFSGTSIVLSSVGRSTRYRCLPQQENVRGHWCHVLEDPFRDKIWIDVDHGCAFIARQISDPTTGSILERVDTFDDYEVSPGIWVPKRYRRQVYSREVPNRVQNDFVLSLLTVEVNASVRSSFVFETPPGSIEISADGSRKQISPGGLDQLDNVVMTARTIGKFDARPVPAGLSGFVVVIANACGVGLVAIIVLIFRLFALVPVPRQGTAENVADDRMDTLAEPPSGTASEAGD